MIVIKIILSFKEYSIKEEEDKLDFILNPIYFDDNPIVFFYGAVVDNICGIGIYLKISTDHIVKAHFVGGTGNNMKVELLDLWGLLLLCSYFSLKKTDGCRRLQGHYRLDKFKIQFESNLSQQLGRQDNLKEWI
jgi:hypothetical protein